MTLNLLAIIFVFLLVALIVIFSLLTCRAKTKRFQLAFLAGHVCFIVIFALYAFPVIGKAQGRLIFLIPFFFDLPISLLLFGLSDIMSGLGPRDFRDFIGPVLFLVIFGSLQYFLIGFVIDKILLARGIRSTKTL